MSRQDIRMVPTKMLVHAISREPIPARSKRRRRRLEISRFPDWESQYNSTAASSSLVAETAILFSFL